MMKKDWKIPVVIWAAVLVTALLAWRATGQTQFSPAQGTQSQNVAEIFALYTPTQLGMNAITLPASTNTANSNTIDMRGVKEATLLGTCTQAVSASINVYNEDGATIYNTGGSSIATAIAANAPFMAHFGSESTINVANGTAAGSVIGMLPQRAMSFFFTNGGATPGTCTARLYLEY